MKKTMIAMMLVASTATFAAEEVKTEAPAVVAQEEIKINVLPAEEKKGFFESVLDSVKGLFD